MTDKKLKAAELLMKVMHTRLAMKEIDKMMDKSSMYENFAYFDELKYDIYTNSQIAISKHWRRKRHDIKKRAARDRQDK